MPAVPIRLGKGAYLFGIILLLIGILIIIFQPMVQESGYFSALMGLLVILGKAVHTARLKNNKSI